MSEASTNRVPVAARALLTRINRHLDGIALKKAKGHAAADLGAYYVLDLRTNEVTARHVDIEKMARDLHLLKPWETVSEDVKWRVVLHLTDGRRELGRVFQRHSQASENADKVMQTRADLQSVSVVRDAGVL